MQKYYAWADGVTVEKPKGFYVEVYIADHVDARIAELERVLINVRDHTECPDCAAEISHVLASLMAQGSK